MAYSVRETKFWGLGGSVNGTGKRPLLHGFEVLRDRRVVRNFVQGTAQKWTPEFAAKLRTEAEAWAVHLGEIFPSKDAAGAVASKPATPAGAFGKVPAVKHQTKSYRDGGKWVCWCDGLVDTLAIVADLRAKGFKVRREGDRVFVLATDVHRIAFGPEAVEAA